MIEPFKPTPPDGYRLHRFEGSRFDPPIMVERFTTLLAFNPHQNTWERPKYLHLADPCWYATKDPT